MTLLCFVVSKISWKKKSPKQSVRPLLQTFILQMLLCLLYSFTLETTIRFAVHRTRNPPASSTWIDLPENLNLNASGHLLDELGEVFTDRVTTRPVAHTVTEESSGTGGSIGSDTGGGGRKGRERTGAINNRSSKTTEQIFKKTDMKAFSFLFR